MGDSLRIAAVGARGCEALRGGDNKRDVNELNGRRRSFRTAWLLAALGVLAAGSVTLAGNRLVILREAGELIVAAASPDAFRPLARAQILPGTVRAYPALSDGFLFVRNDDTLVCLDLRR